MAERPSRAELEAARGRLVPDVIANGLDVLFCGINPGLYSGAVGHHFARPGNRFWKVLAGAGLTPRLLAPEEERELLALGLGITNIVARTTATAAELSSEELRAGADRLVAKMRRRRPRVLAVLGLGAYRQAFGRAASLGEQAEHRIASTAVWVLPNPSGLQARYQLPELVDLFASLHEAVRHPADEPA